MHLRVVSGIYHAKLSEWACDSSADGHWSGGENVVGATVNLYNLMCDRGGAVYSVHAPV
jgi:hypothetical protein